jgi:hypothetical protein
MAPGAEGDPERERQRGEVESVFRERWVPLPGGEPKLLTEREYVDARFAARPRRKTIARSRGKTPVRAVAIDAVRDDTRAGDALPHDGFLPPAPNPAVIIIGRGAGRRVAVLFPSPDFPMVQFGHRFEPDPPGGSHAAAVQLIERIEGGALRQVMDDNPDTDSAVITWTTWGTPNSDPELQWQRGKIESAFRQGWWPQGAGESGELTERAYTEARKILDRKGATGWTGLHPATIQAVRDGAQPGHVLPLLPYIDRVTDAEVILSGSGTARRVAVLFRHDDFPDARFGHRFPLDPFAAEHESIWLKEEMETGALHRMMAGQPPPDSAGIIWTTWGSPARQ